MSDELQTCIQDILSIVNESHSLYYKLLTLSYSIPQPFIKGSSGLTKDLVKLQQTLSNFDYFSKPQKYESKLLKIMTIETTKALFGYDQLEWINSAGSTLEAAASLPSHVQSLLNRLNSNYYFGVNFSTIANDQSTCMYLIEMIASLGKLLLLLDVVFHEDQREQIIVAYYRLFLKESNRAISPFTIPILKTTGFTSLQSLPKHYPFDYFSRCQLNEQQIQQLIDCISTSDLYGMMKYYSIDEHKNYLAYHDQANQAIVLSFFCSSLKNAETRTDSLNDILKKTYSQFQCVELAPFLTFSMKTLYSWAPSCTFVEQLCSNDSFAKLHDTYLKKVKDAIERTDSFVKDKSLDFHLVLTNREDIINIIRNNNYLIQWFTVHYLEPRNRSIAKYSDYMELVLKTSCLEDLTKKAIHYILKNKTAIWGYYHSLLTAYFDSYMSDEIRSLLDDLLNFNEKPTRLTDCYKKLRSLKDMLTTSFVNINVSCHTVIGNMMRMTLLMKEDIERELSVITEFSSGFVFLMGYKQQLLSFLITKKEIALQCISSLFDKLEVIQINNNYAEKSIMKGFLRMAINEFTSSLPETVAKMYSELMATIKENASKMTELPYEIKNELKLYSYPEERNAITNALSQIAAIYTEITKLEKYLKKHSYSLIEERVQQVFIQNCILTLSRILQSYSSITQSTHVKASTPPLLIPIIETGHNLLSFQQTLKQLEEILHFNSSRFFAREYDRIIQYFLYEDIKLLTKDKTPTNPFQHPVYSISPNTSGSKNSIVSSFITNCLTTVTTSDCWYSEASNGWITSDSTVLLNIDSFVLMVNNVGYQMAKAFDQYSKIQISTILRAFRAQIQNQTYVVKYTAMDYTSKQFPHDVRTMIRQYCAETAVNIKLVSKLGSLLLIRCLIQKALYLFKKKTAYEELFDIEHQKNQLVQLLQSTLKHVDRDKIQSALQHTTLPIQNSLPEFAEMIRGFGLAQPIEEIYTSSDSFAELPYALFLVCVSATRESTFDKVSQNLFSNHVDQGPMDGISLAAGVASLLTQQDASYSQFFMELIRWYIRSEICRDATKKELANVKALGRLRWMALKISSQSEFIRESCTSILVDISSFTL